jgi:hypothetical protein
MCENGMLHIFENILMRATTLIRSHLNQISTLEIMTFQSLENFRTPNSKQNDSWMQPL